MSHAVASTDAAQPIRQSAVPASFRLAAPDRPPNEPPTVTRPELERPTPRTRSVACADSAAGVTAANSATVLEKMKRRNMTASTKTGFNGAQTPRVKRTPLLGSMRCQ